MSQWCSLDNTRRGAVLHICLSVLWETAETDNKNMDFDNNVFNRSVLGVLCYIVPHTRANCKGVDDDIDKVSPDFSNFDVHLLQERNCCSIYHAPVLVAASDIYFSKIMCIVF